MPSREYDAIKKALIKSKQVFGHHRGHPFGGYPYDIGQSNGRETVLMSIFQGQGPNNQPASAAKPVA